MREEVHAQLLCLATRPLGLVDGGIVLNNPGMAVATPDRLDSLPSSQEGALSDLGAIDVRSYTCEWSATLCSCSLTFALPSGL